MMEPTAGPPVTNHSIWKFPDGSGNVGVPSVLRSEPLRNLFAGARVHGYPDQHQGVARGVVRRRMRRHRRVHCPAFSRSSPQSNEEKVAGRRGARTARRFADSKGKFEAPRCRRCQTRSESPDGAGLSHHTVRQAQNSTPAGGLVAAFAGTAGGVSP